MTEPDQIDGPHRIFVSYSSKDGKLTEETVAQIEASGLKCWMAPRDVQPGLGYPRQILRAVKAAEVLILMLSNRSNVSPHVANEVERAVSSRLPILVVKIEEVELSESLELFISRSQWLDVSTCSARTRQANLLTALNRLLSETATRQAGGPAAGSSEARREFERLEQESARLRKVFRSWRDSEKMAGLWSVFLERFKTGDPGRAERARAELDFWSREGGQVNSFFNSLFMTFVFIPAGHFIMGSPKSEPGSYRDEVLHRVTLTRPFYLAVVPVTRAQWRALMEEADEPLGDPDRPATGMNWDEARLFLQKLNQQEPGGVYRLPTEAEWEYACRAGRSSAFFQGRPEEDLGRRAWYLNNTDRPRPVGIKEPNPWGLYDMLGNVWEWRRDWYGPYPEGETTDPVGPTLGLERVLRGGGWRDAADYCRPGARLQSRLKVAGDDIDFRAARDA